jgi:CO/xanthine dehydrogenase FAD-binding subunit
MTTPAPFRLVAVTSWDAAVAELAGGDEDARILAGGQSLVPMLNLRLLRPAVLVDVNLVATAEPKVRDGMLVLSALTRYRALGESALVRRHCPVLTTAASHIGNVRVRNRGTVAGSLAHADPTAEVSCVSLALDAQVVIAGSHGKRTIPVSELFVSYLTTVLGPAEVITEVLVPVRRPRQGTSFLEHVRRASDFATVGVAASVDWDDDGHSIRAARVALAGVAQKTELVPAHIMESLNGTSGAADVVAACAAAAAAATDPDDDVHASGRYRKHLVEILTRRCLTQAIADATSPHES